MLDPQDPQLAIGASARLLWNPNGCGGTAIKLNGQDWIIPPRHTVASDPDWPSTRDAFTGSPLFPATLTRTSAIEATLAVDGTNAIFTFTPDLHPPNVHCL
jgi:hypothetical protein